MLKILQTMTILSTSAFVFSLISSPCCGMEFLGDWFPGGGARKHKVTLVDITTDSHLYTSSEITGNWAFTSPETFVKLFGEIDGEDGEAKGFIRLCSELAKNKRDFTGDHPKDCTGVLCVKPKEGIPNTARTSYASSSDNHALFLNQGIINYIEAVERGFKPSRKKGDPIEFTSFHFSQLEPVRSCSFDVIITSAAETPASETTTTQISKKVLEALIRQKFSQIALTQSMNRVPFNFSEKETELAQQYVKNIQLILTGYSGATKFIDGSTSIRMNLVNSNGIKFIEFSHKDPGGTTFADLVPQRQISATEALYGQYGSSSSDPRTDLFNPTPYPQRKLSAADIESIVASSETDGVQIKTLNLDFHALGIGGLDEQLNAFVRDAALSRNAKQETLDRLGITKHSSGVLLYGPPGTGKTLIARQISKILGVKDQFFIKINGPEVLDKYVGGSEEKMRRPFDIAKQNPKELIVLFIDEIDSIGGRRTDGGGAGASVNNNLVNTLLTGMDGVDGHNNILVIGATNRPDMLDEALKREGRFSVQLEIGLPDEQGRKDIFNIKLKEVIENSALKDVDIDVLVDLTANYTGGEISGLCDRARKFALADLTDNPEDLSAIDSSQIFITQVHFINALCQMHPLFAQHAATISLLPENEISLPSQNAFVEKLEKRAKSFRPGQVYSYLIAGDKGLGKSAIAGAFIKATKGYFDFTRIFEPSPTRKSFVDELTQVWLDSQRVGKSLIVLDDLPNLLGILNAGEYDRSAMRALNMLLCSQTHCNTKTGQRNKTMVLVTMGNKSKEIFSYINPGASWSYEESVRENLSPIDITTILTHYNAEESTKSSLVPLLAPYSLSTILDICNDESAHANTLANWKSRISELCGSGTIGFNLEDDIDLKPSDEEVLDT